MSLDVLCKKLTLGWSRLHLLKNGSRHIKVVIYPAALELNREDAFVSVISKPGNVR